MVKNSAKAAAVFRLTSFNAKLSPVTYKTYPGYLIPTPKPQAPFVSSTFVAINKTCSDTCPFKRTGEIARGCFADSGFTKRTAWRLNEAAEEMTSLEVIQQEVTLIDAAFPDGIPQDGARGGRDLRLHVGGDVRTIREARLLAGAAERWVQRGGGTVWTYTHSWRGIPRPIWGPISVLASCENIDDLECARARGYAPALVVHRFPDETGRAWRVGAFRVVPCPAEAREGVTCAECRLCLDRDLHALRVVISFAVHGPTKAAHASLVASGQAVPEGVSLKRTYTKRPKIADEVAPEKRKLPAGVYLAHGQPGKFCARIAAEPSYVHVGTFSSVKEAVKAREEKLVQIRRGK